MEKSSKRGKIPQSDWPSIMARYEAGETLSSIARTYDCSPPAISYVVSRSRSRQSVNEQSQSQHGFGAPRPAAVGEPQLIKASAAHHGDHALHREPPANTAAAPPPVPPAVGEPRIEARFGNGHAFDRSSDPRAAQAPTHVDHRSVQGDPRAPHGDPRGRLHLALGNGNAAHADGAQHPERQPMPPAQPYRPAPQNQHPNHDAAPPQHTNGGHNGNGAHPALEQRKEQGGAFIDRELRARVEADIAAFLGAFDAALAEDTPGSRAGLREATDRLLRAGARTRIELERLEARAPLPPRDPVRPAEAAWRQR
jgi:hypothetical protein